MKNIYVFGECMIELREDKMLDSSIDKTPINQSLDKAKSSKKLEQAFAGDVLNTAVYLKRTFPEIHTNFVSALGKDKFSVDMIRFFEDEQIGHELVFQSEDKMPGLYAIETDKTGERTFSYWRENSAAKEVMSFIDDKAIAQLSQGDMFFFSGISLAVITPKHRALFWQMVEKLKQAGICIVFDPNYRARMWDSPEQAKEQFDKAFALSEVALPGVDDFQQLYDIHSSEGVYEYCQAFNLKELIIKNGELGILCYIDDLAYQFNITPVKNVVDTTSAGDSFNGVYLGARANGLTINHAIELASSAAGFVIQHPGAIVDKTAYQQFMAQQIS
jgi:2-dehydro-3-deoxygluconokinase